MEVHESTGASGGLLLFWQRPLAIQLRDKDKNFIDVTVGDGTDEVWRFTWFYGEPKWEDKHLSWGYIRSLYKQDRLSWMAGGDFNEITDNSEYFGSNKRAEWQMQGFRETIDGCKFQDLGFVGIPYTWDNRQEGAANVKVQLDRYLADPAFIQ